MNSKFEVFSSAPGRVNLIGEHTDYNGGFVLPTLIPQRTSIHISPRSERRVILESDGEGMAAPCEFHLGSEERGTDWAAYLRGATWLLQQKGMALAGFHARVSSTVPIGAGLSSSAALLVAYFRGLKQAFDLPLNDLAIAQFSREVENEFVGARVGFMDQMVVSLATPGAALFMDMRSLSYETVPLPEDKLGFFVIDSGVKHSNANGGYNARRAECEQACELLGVSLLREIEGVVDLQKLPPVLLRRARHVVSENARVLAAVRALRSGQVLELGQLFVESHASLRDDYEVSVPEVNLLVEMALTEPGVFGARMTGGGFGGSIVGICAPGREFRAAEAIVARYQQSCGKRARVVVPEPLPRSSAQPPSMYWAQPPP